VQNNPVNFVDPDGLFAPALPLLIPAFETAAAYTGATIAGLAIGQWIWDTWISDYINDSPPNSCELSGRGEKNKKYEKPINPNRRKGAEERQRIGERERNVAAPGL
jgi:hypothetical protein